MAMRGTITQQLVAANSDEPEQLIAWANDGICIQAEAWAAAITKKPALFALVPARFKTLANCTAAMAADPLLFPKVPEVFRTDEGEVLYHCARRAKQLEEQKRSSAEAESTGGAPASPKPEPDDGSIKQEDIVNMEWYDMYSQEWSACAPSFQSKDWVRFEISKWVDDTDNEEQLKKLVLAMKSQREDYNLGEPGSSDDDDDDGDAPVVKDDDSDASDEEEEKPPPKKKQKGGKAKVESSDSEEMSEEDDDSDDEEESEEESDEDYNESSDGGILDSDDDDDDDDDVEHKVAAASSDEEDDAPLTSRASGKRPIAKKAKAKAEPAPKRGKGPLYGYQAKYRKTGTAASPSTAATGPRRTGIDLSVIETLKGAGRVFGKIFQIANDPGATEDEKANARRKMDQQIAKGDDNVLEALKILTSSDGSSIEAKPGLEHVDIMQNGKAAHTKQKWMSVLGMSIGDQYMVKSCVYTRPPSIGFFGRAELTAAAALDYEESFNFIVGVSSTPSFAQGFSEEHYWINQRLKKQRDAAEAAEKASGANSSTALVVRSNKELVEEAIVEFNLKIKKGRQLKGADRTSADYEAGRAAARVRHSEKETAKTPKLKS